MLKQEQFTQEELVRISYLIERNLQIKFTGRDLGLTNRQVNNWNKEGMFISPLVDGKRKEFDLIEAVWVRLAMELQDYGFSFDEIKEYKKVLGHSDLLELMERIDSGELKRDHPNIANISKLTIDGREYDKDQIFAPDFFKPYREMVKTNPHVLLNLFSHICMASLRKGNYLIAFAHGGVMRFDWSYSIVKKTEQGEEENIQQDQGNWRDLLSGTRLIISLDQILTSLVLTEPKYKKNPRPINFFLNEKEIEIIELLRQHKDCTVFEIQVDKEEPVRVEIAKNLPFVSLETQVGTLFRKNSYTDIQFKVQNGHLNQAVETISIKLSTYQQDT